MGCREESEPKQYVSRLDILIPFVNVRLIEPERPPQTDSQPESGSEMTKKQRQNAAKREAQKAAKAEAEAQRVATLSKHKRELEKAKIAEQYSKKGGGSSASIDKGHLVWD